MRKEEFLETLRLRLAGLPQEEVEGRIAFYGEMIDDRVEEGEAEEAVISEIGTVEEIATQILSEIPLAKIARERIKPKRRLKAWEIVLLALGSPIWLSLMIAAFAVVLSLYVVLWSLIVSVWAVFASLAASAVGGVAAGIIFMCSGSPLSGVATVGAGIVCAGLSILFFFVCKAATRGIVLLTKKLALGIKKCFVRKEAV